MELYNKTNLEIITATQLLAGTDISILDAARLIRNALDFKPRRSKASDMQFCTKLLDGGVRHLHLKEITIRKGFKQYIATKSHLRPDSLKDLKYISNRLLRNKHYANKVFSELGINECEKWINSLFKTPSQYNKAHTMLHALFQFALRNEWVERNTIKLLEKKKVIEKEIRALDLEEINRLIETSQLYKYRNCQVGFAISLWAGVRPKELIRLTWQDIDLEENVIIIRPTTSKTGGVRHIEIPPNLKKILERRKGFNAITPVSWKHKWKTLRDRAGFKNVWTQDVLRHSYASYFIKKYQDIQRLQLNMGHYNTQLLRTRYINLHNISKADAKIFFNIVF